MGFWGALGSEVGGLHKQFEVQLQCFKFIYSSSRPRNLQISEEHGTGRLLLDAKAPVREESSQEAPICAAGSAGQVGYKPARVVKLGSTCDSLGPCARQETVLHRAIHSGSQARRISKLSEVLRVLDHVAHSSILNLAFASRVSGIWACQIGQVHERQGLSSRTAPKNVPSPSTFARCILGDMNPGLQRSANCSKSP